MKKAFTLVELLVVIGILGILMGVLLSTFSGAGDSARAAKCMTNLRNLGMASQAYAMEHGGKLPAVIKSDSENASSGSSWISFSTAGKGGSYISPYAGSLEEREFSLTNGMLWAAINRDRNSYSCPTHQKYAREHNLGLDPLWSYAMNPKVADGNVQELSRADRLLLFAELPFANVKNGEFVQTGQISGEELDPYIDCKTDDGEGGNEVIGFNHKNGKTLCAHVCYADGHVAKLIAPKAGDAKDLTGWLCSLTVKGEGDIDITFDGTRYQKSNATE